MPAFYFIDKERRLVFSSGSGVLTLEDMLGHRSRLLKDPDFVCRWRAGLLRLGCGVRR